MTAYFPPGVSSQGKDLWTSVPTVATKSAMTAVEANAAGSLQINLAMRPGFGASGETARVDDKRLGGLVSYEAFGTTKITLGTITWIDRPQDAAAAATAKHRDTLTEGTLTNFVNRRGLGAASENYATWAASQKYTLYPVQMGPQIESASADEGGQFEYTQDVIVVGAVVKGTTA